MYILYPEANQVPKKSGIIVIQNEKGEEVSTRLTSGWRVCIYHRRLNPHMQEVVRGEVLKLLQAGIIYPISDSLWVSPTQVVPKKSGITVIQNEKGEEVSTRPTTGWRVIRLMVA